MQVVAEILQHLVQRPEDYLENIGHTVKLYREIILRSLEVRARSIWRAVWIHWLVSNVIIKFTLERDHHRSVDSGLEQEYQLWGCWSDPVPNNTAWWGSPMKSGVGKGAGLGPSPEKHQYMNVRRRPCKGGWKRRTHKEVKGEPGGRGSGEEKGRESVWDGLAKGLNAA